MNKKQKASFYKKLTGLVENLIAKWSYLELYCGLEDCLGFNSLSNDKKR